MQTSDIQKYFRNGKLAVLFLFFGFLACLDSEVEQPGPSIPPKWEDVVTDASGRQYPFLNQQWAPRCSPGWGRKQCRFLRKYDGTSWADSENYYSDFSDIMFSNFPTDAYFISFFNLDTITSYCQGWQVGETTLDGLKWNIKLKRDEVDLLWFDYEYYGSSQEIEYTTHYKYEVIYGLLHFSSSDGETFIFHPSERNYSRDVVGTEEIIKPEGCRFY